MLKKYINTERREVLVLSKSSISSLPQTYYNSAIEGDMVCIKSELSKPAAQTGDWTVTTANGSITISGTISDTTNLKMYLAKEQDEITLT